MQQNLLQKGGEKQHTNDHIMICDFTFIPILLAFRDAIVAKNIYLTP